MKSIQGGQRCLAPSCRVGKLVLRLLTFLEHGGQTVVRGSPCERRGVTTLLREALALGDRLQVELRDTRAQARDLNEELLGALGCGRLQGERSEALPHLVLDVTRPLDLRRDTRKLQLGTMPALLELPQASSLLDECAPILGLRGENRVDLPLGDDRVHRPAESHVGEQLNEVGPPHRCLVHEVLALATPDKPPRDRHFAVVKTAESAVLVVEDELDLTVIGRGPRAAAGEQDVVRLLGAKLRGSQAAGRPYDRVGDVRLARAVRPDDDGHPRFELQLERVRERLEAAQAE